MIRIDQIGFMNIGVDFVNLWLCKKVGNISKICARNDDSRDGFGFGKTRAGFPSTINY